MTQPESPHTTTIVVNGRPRTVTGKTLTYAQVIDLAFPGQVPSETKSFTVTFTRGHGDKPQGSMVAGDTVKIKEGMEFDVSATDRS